jgi:putative addiction module component (TIGR02574 family)
MSPFAQTVSELPLQERLQIVWDIWDSIAAEQTDIPLSESDRIELERRLTKYRLDGIKGDTWDVVRKRIESKSKK